MTTETKVLKALDQSNKSLGELKFLQDKYISIRNESVGILYIEHKWSAMKLAERTGLTRDMIYKILKNQKNDLRDKEFKK